MNEGLKLNFPDGRIAEQVSLAEITPVMMRAVEAWFDASAPLDVLASPALSNDFSVIFDPAYSFLFTGSAVRPWQKAAAPELACLAADLAIGVRPVGFRSVDHAYGREFVSIVLPFPSIERIVVGFGV